MIARPEANDTPSAAQRTRILIVEDDAGLARILQAHLTGLHYDVCWAADGASGLEMGLTAHPDIVLLDVGLPVMNGYEVCRRLRAMSGVPVVYLTSACREEDIVMGLYQGADGYVCKPFGLAELTARIEATLRRRAREQGRRATSVYDDGVLYVDSEQSVVRKRGKDLSLTHRELQLLCYLVSHAGEVVSHSELLQVVWGAQYKDCRNYLPLYMRYLRRKIEDDPARPRYLLTRFGFGYYLSPGGQGNGATSTLTEGPS